MNPGEIVLIRLPQTGGAASKLRPALVLSNLLGPYQNVLLCGISTQLHQLQPGWDELSGKSGDAGLRRSLGTRGILA
ncbi:MAG: type II toxin-antitoxin system PemK/MazF family toxin [Planctomycetes bacterium]|nr:type II toxin-antitoxin system PemK/MazF family toxin [Planctomycetota bacterium]